MNFIQIEFFLFFACFLPLYTLLEGRAKIVCLLLASYFFYAYYSPIYCLLLLTSSLVDFFLARAMRNLPEKKKNYVVLSMIFNLSLLGIFKYASFFWNDVLAHCLAPLGLSIPLLQKTLPPVGISFFTFQTMSYAIDVYRGHIAPSASLLRFSTYVAMFPQLVAGPIVRASKLLPQLEKVIRPNLQDWREGFTGFVRGFLKKACIADSLGILLVDPCFADPTAFSSERIALAVCAYSFQIYFDFSGYSDMAIGIGRMLGFQFPENFNHPYRSRNFSEFWTRWHISLSSWLRDYLYIPLGGNRVSKSRTWVNLMLTMLLGGLWHGASVLFILWGFLHGLWLILQRVLEALIPGHLRARIPSGITVALTFILVSLTWIPFRAGDLEVAGHIASALCGIGFQPLCQEILALNWGTQLLLGICFATHFLISDLTRWSRFSAWPMELKTLAYTSAIFWCMHFFPENAELQPFIYFQF